MTRYLISFNDGAMEHIPDEDMPAVGKAAHAVVQEALNAGVYLFAGGGPIPNSTRYTAGQIADD